VLSSPPTFSGFGSSGSTGTGSTSSPFGAPNATGSTSFSGFGSGTAGSSSPQFGAPKSDSSGNVLSSPPTFSGFGSSGSTGTGSTSSPFGAPNATGSTSFSGFGSGTAGSSSLPFGAPKSDSSGTVVPSGSTFSGLGSGGNIGTGSNAPFRGSSNGVSSGLGSTEIANTLGTSAQDGETNTGSESSYAASMSQPPNPQITVGAGDGRRQVKRWSTQSSSSPDVALSSFSPMSASQGYNSPTRDPFPSNVGETNARIDEFGSNPTLWSSTPHTNTNGPDTTLSSGQVPFSSSTLGPRRSSYNENPIPTARYGSRDNDALASTSYSSAGRVRSNEQGAMSQLNLGPVGPVFGDISAPLGPFGEQTQTPDSLMLSPDSPAAYSPDQIPTSVERPIYRTKPLINVAEIAAEQRKSTWQSDFFDPLDLIRPQARGPQFMDVVETIPNNRDDGFKSEFSDLNPSLIKPKPRPEEFVNAAATSRGRSDLSPDLIKPQPRPPAFVNAAQSSGNERGQSNRAPQLGQNQRGPELSGAKADTPGPSREVGGLQVPFQSESTRPKTYVQPPSMPQKEMVDISANTPKSDRPVLNPLSVEDAFDRRPRTVPHSNIVDRT